MRLVGFGTFLVSQRAKSDGRNPRTGAKISIPASKHPKFKAGKGWDACTGLGSPNGQALLDALAKLKTSGAGSTTGNPDEPTAM